MAASSSKSVETSVLSASEEKTNGTRLARLLIDGGTHAMRRFFNTFHTPETLKDALNNSKSKLQKIPPSQRELLFPSSNDPDSEKFDVTLLHLLLREICNLTAPARGWHVPPADDDNSPEASIVRIKWVRNWLSHRSSTGVSDSYFEHYWGMICSSIRSLELSSLKQELDRLKNDPIDHETQRKVDESVEKWKLNSEIEQEDIELSSCIPDEGSQVFGRREEIEQVKEYVLSGTGVVLITGGPGFGKTTIAKEAARVLDQAGCGIKVFFCSIVSKATLDDVATEMILACRRNSAHSPENPKLWIRMWSRSHCEKEKVVFVLDNADGILDSKEQDTFLSLLEEMRKLSRQNVTFVITSRKAFTNPNLKMGEVKLSCLPLEAAKRVLLSRVPNHIRCKLCEVDTLAELCGHVPLALCIAGSLLSDFNENKLVKQLQEKPLDVLKDEFGSRHQRSVENAIRTSLDNLKEVDKKGLVLLAAFPGPFNQQDALDVLEMHPELIVIPPEKILRSLKNRSLVESHSFEEDSRRYEIHLLVRACAEKTGQDTYPELYSLGKYLACSHFISRICENARLYWSKNGCKQSLQCFNEERDNFEYFLELFVDIMNCPDSHIVEALSAFLDDFPQKCMYLERCLLPSVYKKLLEKLLKTFSAADESVVYKVELLCLTWHESRKEHGHHDEYKKYMNEAKKIYSKNVSKFQTRALSEVLFTNYYARFLSEQRDQTSSKEQYEIALKVCQEKLGSHHPETAATLLFAGRNAKRCKDYDEAEKMLKKALNSFQESLEDHFMTSQTLKDLADFYFFRMDSSNPKFDTFKAEAKKCYEEALEMMTHLGLDNHKECVLTLKNFGMYQTRCENHKEALRLLERANQIADGELEEDHRWKVMVTIALALAYEGNRKEDMAVKFMTQGLQMWSRIKDPGDRLKNRHIIRKFLDSRSEVFPEEQFPRNVLLGS